MKSEDIITIKLPEWEDIKQYYVRNPYKSSEDKYTKEYFYNDILAAIEQWCREENVILIRKKDLAKYMD